MLALILFACSGGPPSDTVASSPPSLSPASTLLLAEASREELDSVCAQAVGFNSIELGCGGTVVFGPPSVEACVDALSQTDDSCALTSMDLLECTDLVAMATCASDFATDPCAALFESGCDAVEAFATDLLGGPYGLQDGLAIELLSSAQQSALCLELTDYEPVVLDCPDFNTTIEPASLSDCVSSLNQVAAGCTATLADARDCVDIVSQATCATDFNAGGCGALNACQ